MDVVGSQDRRCERCRRGRQAARRSRRAAAWNQRGGGDLDGDGVVDAVGSEDGRVYALDGRTGRLLNRAG